MHSFFISKQFCPKIKWTVLINKISHIWKCKFVKLINMLAVYPLSRGYVWFLQLLNNGFRCTTALTKLCSIVLVPFIEPKVYQLSTDLIRLSWRWTSHFKVSILLCMSFVRVWLILTDRTTQLLIWSQER